MGHWVKYSIHHDVQLIEQEAKERSLSLPREISSLWLLIEFTMEMDNFLDRCTKKHNEEGMGNICVYMKPKHTDCYLQYSHHPNHVKCSIASSPFHWASVIHNTKIKQKKE